MDEHVLAAIVRLDEAEALVVVEPFDRAADLYGGRRIGMTAGGTRLIKARRGTRSAAPAVSTSSTRVTCAPLAPVPT